MKVKDLFFVYLVTFLLMPLAFFLGFQSGKHEGAKEALQRKFEIQIETNIVETIVPQ